MLTPITPRTLERSSRLFCAKLTLPSLTIPIIMLQSQEFCYLEVSATYLLTKYEYRKYFETLFLASSMDYR